MANRGWREYWRDNRLAACVPENPGAAAAIEAHWSAWFSSLANGARILDIATGNGVLLLWARRAARARGRTFALTGIDLADIDPARFVRSHADELDGVVFRGKTAAEDLPFENDSFDVVVSQYGFEYAALGPALAEIARVLAPGGRLQLLAHSDDSVVVAQGRERLREIDLLLADDGPFATMDSYLTARARGRKVNRATQALTDSLKVAQRYCESHPAATLVNQLCRGILDTANSLERYDTADVRRWLDENRRRLRAQRQRHRDLMAARLTASRREELDGLLATAEWRDARTESLLVGAKDLCVGEVISARRRDAG